MQHIAYRLRVYRRANEPNVFDEMINEHQTIEAMNGEEIVRMYAVQISKQERIVVVDKTDGPDTVSVFAYENGAEIELWLLPNAFKA